MKLAFAVMTVATIFSCAGMADTKVAAQCAQTAAADLGRNLAQGYSVKDIKLVSQSADAVKSGNIEASETFEFRVELTALDTTSSVTKTYQVVVDRVQTANGSQCITGGFQDQSPNAKQYGP